MKTEKIAKTFVSFKTLQESLESNADIAWQKNVNQWIGIFNLDGDTYRIKIEEMNDLSIFIPNIPETLKSVFVVKFSRMEAGKKEFSISLSKKGKFHFTVFGTLKKAIEMFIEEVNPDVLFFLGNDERKSLYSKLLGLAEIKYSETYSVKELSIGSDNLFIMIKLNFLEEVSKIEKSKELIDSIRKK